MHRDDFVLEIALHGRLMRQTVRTHTERVLCLTGDAMHLAEHLGGQPHHPRSLGRVQRHVRVRIDTVHHADVAHVLDTTDDEDVTVVAHDRLSCGVQRTH